jgi:PAS domain S-box-containing protein
VVVAGQPIEIGDAPCMLFTFADLEPRRKAESALRDSEERFAKAFRLVPVPTAIFNAGDERIVEVNDAFRQFFGYALQDAVGQSTADLRLWAEEAERERFRTELARAGTLRGYEAQLQPKDGSTVTCLIAAETVTIGGQACILTVFQDITSRKRSEEDLARAIEAVMADASWFSQGVVEKLAALRQPARPGQPADQAAGMADLTAREREILGLVCQGRSDAEIAAGLAVARNTVRNHLAALFRKLGVNRRSAVIVWARERGIGGEGVEARPRTATPAKPAANPRRRNGAK